MGNRARTHSVSAEFEVDADGLPRRSDMLLAMVAAVNDSDPEEGRVPPDARTPRGTSSEDAVLSARDVSATDAAPGVSDGHVVVRRWLARKIGCKATELSVIERRNATFDVVFARNGEPYGQTYLLAPQVPGGWQGSVALIAAWKPGRWCQEILGPGTSVEW